MRISVKPSSSLEQKKNKRSLSSAVSYRWGGWDRDGIIRYCIKPESNDNHCTRKNDSEKTDRIMSYLNFLKIKLVSFL